MQRIKLLLAYKTTLTRDYVPVIREKKILSANQTLHAMCNVQSFFSQRTFPPSLPVSFKSCCVLWRREEGEFYHSVLQNLASTWLRAAIKPFSSCSAHSRHTALPLLLVPLILTPCSAPHKRAREITPEDLI